MASHAAFHPLTPRAATPAPAAFAGRTHSQLGISARRLTRTEGGELSGVDEFTRHLLTQIIQHPRFDALFPLIVRYLELPNPTWIKYASLRGDFNARIYLESIQPALWYFPPDDLWAVIVQLRQHNAFSSLQSDILAKIKNAFDRLNLAKQPQRSLATTAYGQSIPYSTTGSVHPAAPSQHAGGQVGHTSRWGQYDLPASHESLPTSPSNSMGSVSIITPSTQKHSTRQAPKGWRYGCPSKGCPMTYIRQGHYKKHLDKQHPDFELQHPDHSLEMSLKPENEKDTLVTKTAKSTAYANSASPSKSNQISGQSTFSASRRGSQASSTSQSPSALASRATSNGNYQSYIRPHDHFPFESWTNWQGSDIWHAGSGMENFLTPAPGEFYANTWNHSGAG